MSKLVLDANTLTAELREIFRAWFAYWNAHRPIKIVIGVHGAEDGKLREVSEFEMASFLDHFARDAAHRVMLLDEDIAKFAAENLGLEAG
jgi:hypothetical protein